MAGHPLAPVIMARLQEQQEAILEQLSRGIRKTDIAANFDVSMRSLNQWMFLPKNKAVVAEAMQTRASAMVEQALDIADAEPRLHPVTGAIDGADIQRNKQRIEIRKWIAARADPASYGDSSRVETKVDVTVTLGGFLSDIKGDKLSNAPIDGYAERVDDEVSDL